MVGVAPALRLEGPRPADEGAGRRDERAAAHLRRGAGRGADHRRRAAAHADPDGARDQGPGHRPLRVDRLHLDQRGAGRAREVRGVRSRRAGVRRREDRLRRARRRPRPCARSASSPSCVPSGTTQSSEGLLADFPPFDDVLDPIDRVLLPRADIATETLAAGLRELGWEIDDVTAYRTVRAAPPAAEIRDAIKSGGFQAVCFTSSSTVRNLVGIAGKPHARTVVACIGPQTAATAREFGLRVDVQPEAATVPALIDALAEFARRPGRGGEGEGRGRGGEEGGPHVGPPRRPLTSASALVRARGMTWVARTTGSPNCPRSRRSDAGSADNSWAGRARNLDGVTLPDLPPFPTSRPRRLRRTAGAAPAGQRRRGAARRTSCCRCSSARASTEARADHLDARRRAALARVAGQGGGRGGRGRRRRADDLRRARGRRTPAARAPTTPTACSTSRCADLRAELGDATVLMSDLCLDEFTDHGHCGVLDEHGAVDNDATLHRYAAMGAGPGRGRRAPARHQRDDGRPGRRGAPRARRRRLRRHRHPGLRAEVRVRASTARSARR